MGALIDMRDFGSVNDTSVGVGANVYVQFGRITGPAPTLPIYDLTV